MAFSLGRADTAAEQVVFNDATECTESVLPSDLFSFSVSAAVVRHRHFKHTHVELANFCRDLGLETETIFFDRNFLKHIATERFVTRLHVAEVQVGYHVRNGS